MPESEAFKAAIARIGRDGHAEALLLCEAEIARGTPTPKVLASYADALLYLGRTDEAMLGFGRALVADPHNTSIFDNIVFSGDHGERTTPALALELRKQWWHLYGVALARHQRVEIRDRSPDRPLRVGYVSGDFRSHSANRLFSSVCLHHSPAVQPYVYFSAPLDSGDRWTSEYSRQCIFRHILDVRTEEAAELIRRDQIDILVDLAGYSAYGRLDIFCVKPAPIQLHAWGYILGTGFPTVDYIFGDPVTMPLEDQRHFSEQIIHLPCVIPYAGVEEATPVTPLPCLTGPVLFGSCARSTKLTPMTLRLWRAVLEAVPDSRLLLKSQTATQPAAYREVVLQGLGVPAERIIFEGNVPYAQYLDSWLRVDLALDSYPAAAGLTLLDALWMGVPHVTLAGDRVVNRIPKSVYGLIGLEGFVAETQDDYIELAVRWVTTRREELAAWRQDLRSRLAKSPLAEGYVDAVEAAYRAMWRRWLQREAS